MERYLVEILVIIIVLLGVWLVLSKKRDGRVNIPEEVRSLPPLEVRIVRGKNHKTSFINVEFKGMIPIHSTTNLAFTISIFTKDKNGKVEPVLSVIDTFQKPKTKAFQDFTKIGVVHENTGCADWTAIGVIPTEILQPAFSGRQNLKIHTMLIDIDNPPKDFDDKGLALISSDYIYHFNVQGYHEEEECINKARSLSIELGIAVAFSDEVFHEQEEKALNNWIQKTISPYGREKRIQLKGIYDVAFKNAIKLAEEQKIDDESICKELYEIGAQVQKYEALELVHEIMLADNEEHPKEAQIISKIATLLGIDDEELEYIRNHKIDKLDKPLSKVG